MPKLNAETLHRLGRFVATGFGNAFVSLGVLNLCFYSLHMSKLSSSIVGTICALSFSFFMNRAYVFRVRDGYIKQQLILFLVITIMGSVVLLNVVFGLTVALLGHGLSQAIVSTIHGFTGLSLGKDFVEINGATVVGALAAMVWNYNGYTLFVFKKRALRVGQEPSEATEHAA